MSARSASSFTSLSPGAPPGGRLCPRCGTHSSLRLLRPRSAEKGLVLVRHFWVTPQRRGVGTETPGDIWEECPTVPASSRKSLRPEKDSPAPPAVNCWMRTAFLQCPYLGRQGLRAPSCCGPRRKAGGSLLLCHETCGGHAAVSLPRHRALVRNNQPQGPFGCKLGHSLSPATWSRHGTATLNLCLPVTLPRSSATQPLHPSPKHPEGSTAGLQSPPRRWN